MLLLRTLIQQNNLIFKYELLYLIHNDSGKTSAETINYLIKIYHKEIDKSHMLVRSIKIYLRFHLLKHRKKLFNQIIHQRDKTQLQ